MMENYDRTIELVETAYDSAGRGEEQFAKSQDTLQVKLNTLSNTWEQFRLKFFNQKFFKDIIDMMNKLLDKISKFDAKQVLSLGLIGITLGKLIVTNLIKQLKNSTSAIQTAWNEVMTTSFKDRFNGTADAKFLNSIGYSTKQQKQQIYVDQITSVMGPQHQGSYSNLSEQTALTQELQKQIQAYQKLSFQAEVFKDTSKGQTEEGRTQSIQMQKKLANQLESIDNLRKELGYETEITKENIEQLAVETKGISIKNQENGFFKSDSGKQFVQGVQGGITSGLSAGLTTAITTVIAGGDVMSALKNAGLTAVSIFTTSILSSLAPILIGSLAGTGGLIAALVAAIAVGVIAAKTATDKQKELEKAELDRIKNVGKANEELLLKQEKILKDYNSKQKEIENFTKNKERYDYLSRKAVLTSDEKEEKANLAEDFNENYPEIVKSFDENTNNIVFNTQALNNLTEELIQQKQTLGEQAVLNSSAQSMNLSQSIVTFGERLSDYLNPSEVLLAQYDGNVEAAIENSYLNKRTIVGAINWEYLEDAGMSKELYEQALNGSDKKFKEALETARLSLNQFAGIVETAGNAQLEDYKNQLQEKNENFIKTRLITQDINEDVANIFSKIDLGDDLSSIMQDKVEDSYKKYFNEITNSTFSGGHWDPDKDFLEDLEKGVFSRISKENYSSDDFANIWAMFGYTQDGSNNTKAMSELFDNNTTNLVMFEQLSEEMQTAVKAMGYAADDWDKDRKDAKKSTEKLQRIMAYGFISQEGILPEGIDEEFIKRMSPQLTNVAEAIADYGNKTMEEYITDIEKEIETINFNNNDIENGNQDNILNSIEQKKQDAIIEWQQNQIDLYNWATGNEIETFEDFNSSSNAIIHDFISSLSKSSTETLNKTVQDLNTSEYQKQQLLTNMAENFKNYDSNISDILLSIDLSKSYDELIENEDEYIKMLESAGKNAEEAADIYSKYITEITTILAKAILGKGGAEGIKSSLNATFSTFNDTFDKIFSAQEEFYENGKISSETYFDLLENGFEEYVDITKDGYVLLADKAEEYYVKSAKKPRDQLKKAISDNKALLQNVRDTYKEYQDKDINTLLSAYRVDGFSAIQEEDAKLRNLIQTISESGYNSYEEYIQAIIDGTTELESLEPKVYIQTLVAMEEHYKDLSENTKELEEDLSDLQDELADLQDELADLNNELLENQEAINDAYKAWQEAIHGTTDYQSSIDGLINYNNLLEQTERNLNKIKDSFKDIQSVNEGLFGIQQLKNITEQQLGQLGAEKQVIDNAMNNVYQTLANNYGAYTKFDQNGMLIFDFSIETADMPDAMKDNYQTLIEQYNDFVEQKQDIADKEDSANQTFLDMQKEFLDSRVSMEEKVIDILKEQMQEEIDQVNEKYEAIEEADNNYLDALEDAIKKQRELREQENKYEDLAQKQKKLSLMQRDTSGANQKEVQNLEKDLQKDRQDLLDNEVDNLIDSLKELYEKQAEARELEIEAMELTIEDMSLLNQMAQDIIANFQTSDDIVAWFLGNNPEVNDMTVAQTEQYINEIKDESSNFLLAIAAQTENVTLDAQRVAEITQSTFESVAEGITDVGTVAQEQAEKTAQEAIDSAKEAYDNAVQTMQDTKEKIVETNDEIIKTHNDILDKEREVQKAREVQADAYKNTMEEMVEASKSAMTEVAYHAAQFLADAAGSDVDLSSAAGVAQFARDKGIANENNEVSLGTYNGLKDRGLNVDDLTVRERIWYQISYNPPDSGAPSQVVDSASSKEEADAIISRLEQEDRAKGKKGSYGATKMVAKYASGGLVNYTGPAWVDGTPSKPEAFLSSEDTARIGEAAKILASLPALQSTSNTSNISTTNVGDTTIEIHLNIEKVSNDYDIDQMIDRIKKDIVDVSNTIGTSVILKK